MTEAEIVALQQEVETLRAANDDLTAERDSLREENAELVRRLFAAGYYAGKLQKMVNQIMRGG